MENCKELFINAFMEAEQISNAEFMNTKNADIIFSKAFEQKMNKLLKKDKRIHFSTRRKIRNGLIAAIIAIIIAFTGLMSITATRTPFVEFMKKEFPQFNEITLSDESTPPVDTIETEYTLTDLPKGYEIDTYQKDDYSVYIIWENTNGEEIVFFQEILDSNLSIDTEHNYKEITINGYEAYLNQFEFNSSLKWTDGYYWFILSVPNNLKNDLINIAENISEKN